LAKEQQFYFDAKPIKQINFARQNLSDLKKLHENQTCINMHVVIIQEHSRNLLKNAFIIWTKWIRMDPITQISHAAGKPSRLALD